MGGVPLRVVALGRADCCADSAQERLSVSGLMSPNEWRISGSRTQAKRCVQAVRCMRWLGADNGESLTCERPEIAWPLVANSVFIPGVCVGRETLLYN